MDRRSFVIALAGWAAAPLLAQDDARPRHKISPALLYESLSARFPLPPGIPGLAQIQVDAPGLLLLPARNKLGASLHAEASGSAVGRAPPGVLDLVFALRYESADRSIRAHEPEILGMDWPGLTVEAQQALRALLPDMARQMAAELVLHRFTARELSLPDTMGFEPSTLTVVDDGVLVGFREKRMRAG
mgnify:CR=1 FL=1